MSKYTSQEIEALGDQLGKRIAEIADAKGGIAWILIVAEPGNEGALRSNYTERSSVAQSLRETLRRVYPDA
jgi:hypothetical protein